MDLNFLSISAADIMSKWQGESEKAIRDLFKKARELIRKTGKSCMIFIDEIDSIGRKRDADTNSSTGESHKRILTELLRQMDGLNDTSGSSKKGDIIVIGATNHAEELDFALRRRFEKRIYIPLPGIKTRVEILKKTFNETKDSKALHDINLKELIDLARMTKGYSSSDLSVVINESLMRPVRRCLKAEYFKPVFADGKSAETSSNMFRWRRFFSAPIATTLEALKTSGRDYKLVPCNRNDPGAIKINILDDTFPADRLQVPKVSFEDLRASAEKLKPSVSDAEVEKHEAFAVSFSGSRNQPLKDSETLTDRELGYIDPREARKRNKRAKEITKQQQLERQKLISTLPVAALSMPFFVLHDDLPPAPSHDANKGGEEKNPRALLS